MSGISLREPAKDERRFRRGLWVLGAVVTASMVLAGGIIVTSQKPEYAYRFALSFVNPSTHPFTLIVPLPTDADLRATCRWVGDVTAQVGPSDFGTALHAQGTGGLGILCAFNSTSLKPLTFSTEGSSPSGHPAVRIFLDSGGTATAASVNVSVNETGKEWITTRHAQGAVLDGWTPLEIKDTLDRVQSRT